MSRCFRLEFRCFDARDSKQESLLFGRIIILTVRLIIQPTDIRRVTPMHCRQQCSKAKLAANIGYETGLKYSKDIHHNIAHGEMNYQ